MFRNTEGFLPGIIERIWKQRDEAKKRKDETASYALKILMNSLYGAIGNPGCRYHNLNISNAITHTCQKIIKLAAEKIREKGYEIIYGDTDSVFVVSKADNLEDAQKIGKELESSMNEFLDSYIKEEYHRKSFLELEFEKTYKRFMLPRTRSGGSAKKRYAGLLMKGDEEKIDITGMEFVRGDWCDAAREFQYHILELIFSGQENEVKKYIKEYVKDIKAGKMDEKLILRKAIRKETVEYTKTTPPHVRAARKLEDEGVKLESNIIEYYMTPGNDPSPKELMKGQKIDYEYYITKQIEPLADTILSFYGSTFEDLMAGSSQKGLGAFF